MEQVPAATNTPTAQLATRMGSVIGSVEQFDVRQPNLWGKFLSRIDLHFRANQYTALPDAVQRDIFLSLAGGDVFDIVVSLAAPEPYESQSLAQIRSALTAHFTPRDVVLLSTFKFGTRSLKPDESAAEFSAALRSLAKDCDFGNYLGRALRDRFVIGLRNSTVRERLFMKVKELTFQEAVGIATTAELASAHSKVVGGASTSVIAHATTSRNRPPARKKATAAEHTCAGCNGDHSRSSCPYRSTVCDYCKMTGHIARACRKKTRGRSASRTARPSSFTRNPAKSRRSDDSVSHARCSAQEVDMEIDALGNIILNNVTDHVSSPPPITVVVTLNGLEITMEVDSGSPITVISKHTFDLLSRVGQPSKVHPFNRVVRNANYKVMTVLGLINIPVLYQGRSFESLPIVVIVDRVPSLLGRSWFMPLGIYVVIHQCLTTPESCKVILDEFKEVFESGLGQYTGPPLDLNLDSAVKPFRFKPRRIPLGIRDKVDAALDSLISQGVIEPVADPAWGTPVVPILKKDGTVRLCGDYKITINKAIQPHPHPVPVIAHLLSGIGSASVFGRVDLAQADLQCTVTDRVALAQTIVTHRGAFKVKRLQFGISCAPGYFQDLIENLLYGIPDVIIYFDDIVIASKTPEAFEASLRKILALFKQAGLRLKRDNEGIRPSPSKFAAIQNYPEPRSKKELQQFLGLINFYSSFLKDKASVAEPLHRLLDKDRQWSWNETTRNAFNRTKNLLVSDALLIHFDLSKPIILVCDASPYGVGAVLCHRLPNGREAPVAYFSKTLSSAERNYAQIDKEALAIISGVKKFHHFLYGLQFEVHTDHKPLLGIFNPSRPIPDIISPRMLRWLLLLGAYNYTLVHKPGSKITHADALSRSPARVTVESQEGTFLDVSLLWLEDRSPVTADEIAAATRRDHVLSRVLDWTLRVRPLKCEQSDVQPFYSRSSAMSVHRSCLLWVNRVVIPQTLRERILATLHIAHPGISYASQPRREDPITWGLPKNPWRRLHIDFAGPFHGKVLFLVVDAYSGWLEVSVVGGTSAQASIQVLRSLFATHGIPEAIVSDNGTAFTSSDFQRFCKANAIRHILIAPFHPSSNGRAEQTVRSVKTTLRKVFLESSNSVIGDWRLALNRFLIQQHVTPQSADSDSPAELLMGRKLQTVLDAIRPDRSTHATTRGSKRVSWEPRVESEPSRAFTIGASVFARNFGQGSNWMPGEILQQTGPVTYEVRVGDSIIRRHIDQLRHRDAAFEALSPTPANDTPAAMLDEDCPSIQHDAPTGLPPTPPPRNWRNSVPSVPSNGSRILPRADESSLTVCNPVDLGDTVNTEQAPPSAAETLRDNIDTTPASSLERVPHAPPRLRPRRRIVFDHGSPPSDDSRDATYQPDSSGADSAD
ncbi:uncharacterized protein K02A2.6-like [Polistes fuscatus]|uniref:uncharacterized protein K02A2.6-like n=1 Tax=Polistes fuscatus TaxID=30207 RepID=UPI001CA83825|nr:uncharacterized protein K02A2.6-like [Polistes fuscatus]